ncbi:hypothetical protein [Vagococcus elongatus]
MTWRKKELGKLVKLTDDQVDGFESLNIRDFLRLFMPLKNRRVKGRNSDDEERGNGKSNISCG